MSRYIIYDVAILAQRFGSSCVAEMSDRKRARLEHTDAGHWIRPELVQVADHCWVAAEKLARAKESAAELRKIFVRKFSVGKLDAQEFALVAHHIGRSCGMGLGDLALRPEFLYSNGSRHIKDALALTHDMATTELVPTPGFRKQTARRITMDIAIQSCGERLNKEYAGKPFPAGEDPLVTDNFIDFLEHPARARALSRGLHWSRCIALSLYWDGVRHTKHENFEGFFFMDIRTRKRFLSFTVLRSDCCQCGCNGWCTFYPLLVHLMKDINAGAHGTLANGEPLDIALIPCETRSDWPAATTIFALRTWAHSLYPCLCCSYTKLQMMSGVRGFIANQPLRLIGKPAFTLDWETHLYA